jgi:hypothetical protein
LVSVYIGCCDISMPINRRKVSRHDRTAMVKICSGVYVLANVGYFL